jgi:3-hydroxyacyl-[acyl-carrier-protein] dehydratase
MRFLFVDRICELDKEQRVRAIKNIGWEEDFLEEVFPGIPIFSPAIVTEAAAQALSWLIVEARGFTVKPLITVLDSYVCHKHVQPGDQIEMEGVIESIQHESALASARILINKTPAIEINHGVCYLYPLAELEDLHNMQTQFQNLCAQGTAVTPASSLRVPLLTHGVALPQGQPAIDRILECEEGVRIECIKNITMTADYFNDHFPRKPILPGVIIMDALIRCARILIDRTLAARGFDSKKAILLRSQKVKFRKFVQPGDQLRLQVKLLDFQPQHSTVAAKALVQDKMVATLAAEFSHMTHDEYIKAFLY